MFLAHEELAQLTEAERLALQNSNDFFEFGDEDGESLEPEPQVERRNLIDTRGKKVPICRIWPKMDRIRNPAVRYQWYRYPVNWGRP